MRLDQTVHLSFGDLPGSEYLRQLIADHLIHAWDLATATGQPVAALAPAIAEAALAWSSRALRPEFRGDEASGRGFGPEVPVPPGAPAYDRLAGWLGRAPSSSPRAPR